MNISKAICAALVALTLSSSLVLAQTPTKPTNNPPPIPLPKPPVPNSVVNQAKAQAKGNFTDMKRAGVGGQVQDAWDEAEKTDGVFRYEYCRDCTYKVRLREHMVTVIVLPAGEKIDKADVGDAATFQVQVRGPNLLAIKPSGFGIDTNLMVYGTSGAIYPFYLRAESFNSINISDLLVRIEGTLPKSGGGPDIIGQTEPTKPSAIETVDLPPLKADAVAGLKQSDPLRAGDFVQEAAFDPDKLRGWGEYKLWSGGTNGEGLRPETVFRDDYFTYIRFGEKWNNLELPTAYVVVDGIDELVNTRVTGRTFIVESTQGLITLKSGESYLCIQFVGTL